MDSKNLIIIGLAVVIVTLVAALLITGVVNIPGGSKYKSSEEVSGATVDIGSGVENIGSTLEEIDKTLG